MTTNETIGTTMNGNKSEQKLEKKKKKRKDRSKKEKEIETDDNDNCDEENTRERKKQKKAEKRARKALKKERKEKKEKNKDKNDDSTNDEISLDLRGIISSSAKYTDPEKEPKSKIDTSGVTLLLFYQYVEPPWTNNEYQEALKYAEKSASSFQLTGRMRVAKEGFNCTLTGSFYNVRKWCIQLRQFSKPHFQNTEFKLTDHLPERQAFPKLNCFHVQELVNYGLTGSFTPSIDKTGTHLEPQQYHDKMKDNNTVVIDVRNHYEAAIGHFTPPTDGAKLIDPKMRKSTEFPVWLDKPETKQLLKDKQVLMYCTGGVRCERASALLRQKMETEDDVKELNIKGVYQLQGGVDKYFKSFPDGGFWKGKNYTFDKRFSHAPPNLAINNNSQISASSSLSSNNHEIILGKCEACSKPWDMYRGKRRCPTCGVPSLICKDCFEKDTNNIKKLDKTIRCKLCIEQNITSKLQIKQNEIYELEHYALKQREKMKLKQQPEKSKIMLSNEKSNVLNHNDDAGIRNPENITRLFVKNMCIKNMDEETLCQTLPGITHIQWLSDRLTGKFYGSAFVEMATPEDASHAVAKNGKKILGRPIVIKFQKADGKDIWPPHNCAIAQ